MGQSRSFEFHRAGSRLFYESMITSPPNASIRTELKRSWQDIQTRDQQELFLIGVLVGATSLDDKDMLREWMPECQSVLSQVEIEEAVLQTMLFAGFPKTIEALKVLREYFPAPVEPKQVSNHTKAGEATSKKVYGVHHSRLKEVMDELHPDLTRWMIEDGYGRVLSRPGLNLQKREIGVITSLMASGMINQFRAHVRGAVNTGIHQVDIIWFTNIFKCIIAPDLREAFDQVVQQILDV